MLLYREKAVEVLVALRERPMYVTELMQVVGGSRKTVNARIKDFKKVQLIKQKILPSDPYKHYLFLTKSGYVESALAMMVAEAERKILENKPIEVIRIMLNFYEKYSHKRRLWSHSMKWIRARAAKELANST